MPRPSTGRTPTALKLSMYKGDPARAARWLGGWLRNVANVAASSLDPALIALTGVSDSSALAEGAQQLVASYVAEARTHGATWDEIAACLGVTRQAAQQRYGGD